MLGLPRGADELDKELYGEEAHRVNFFIVSDKNRRVIRIYKYGGKLHRNTNFARYIMERHLKRRLLSTEDVHHIDENQLNDDMSNLVILDESTHVKNHNIINYPKIKKPCIICGDIIKVVKSRDSMVNTCKKPRCRYEYRVKSHSKR